MNQTEHSDILIRLGKFDDYKGPICLNVQTKETCEFCNDKCNGISSKVIRDALSLDKKNLFFEELESFYQATNILVPNNEVRGNFDKFSIIFKLDKNIGRIRTDLLLKIRTDFIEKSNKLNESDETTFAQEFCTFWENQIKNLKYVTEFEEERLRTEEALNNANEILSAKSLIVRYDTRGIFTFLNPFAQIYFGYDADELIGKNVVGTILPERNPDGKRYAEQFKKFAEDPRAFEFREVPCRLKDGSTKWIAWTNKPIYDNDGELIEILSVGIDITSLKDTQQQLASEKAIAQLYFDIAGVMLIVLDKNMKISKINKKGQQLLGYSEEEVIGLDWCENFVPKKYRENVEHDLEAVRNGKNEYTKNYILNKDGDQKLIFWHNALLFDEKGEFNGILASGEDITEQKEAEKKIIKEKAVRTLKDQFL